MHRIATLLLGFALLAPGLADARPQGSAECRHLTSQIEFFGARVERARKLDNDVWEDRLTGHLRGLVKQREDRCPGYSDSKQAAQAFQRLLELAAKGAVTFFTMGAF